MVEEDLSIEDCLVKGSGGRLTTRWDEYDKPLVVRGVIKRKEIHDCISRGRDYYYIDTGYFGNFKSPGNPSGKKIWHRVVKNNLQHVEIKKWEEDRWQRLLDGDPRLKWTGWKRGGNKILLIVPNPKSTNFYGQDYDTWLKETKETIQANTDMPIVVREKGSRSERHENSIYTALDQGVFATVAFNSIAAMESVAYGIPAFVSVPCAASPLVSTDLTKISDPIYPDPDLIRQQCINLSYGQFTSKEITNGYAWQMLQKGA